MTEAAWRPSSIMKSLFFVDGFDDFVSDVPGDGPPARRVRILKTHYVI